MGRPTNTQFALAVHLLTLLGGAADEVLSSDVLASSAGSNPAHIRRVLAHLRSAGLVASRPGVRGGWQIVADGSDLTLADVWRAVQGNDPVLGLHDADPACTVGQRIQRELVGIDRAVARAVESELRATSVRQLVHRTSAGELSAPVRRA